MPSSCSRPHIVIILVHILVIILTQSLAIFLFSTSYGHHPCSQTCHRACSQHRHHPSFGLFTTHWFYNSFSFFRTPNSWTNSSFSEVWIINSWSLCYPLKVHSQHGNSNHKSTSKNIFVSCHGNICIPEKKFWFKFWFPPREWSYFCICIFLYLFFNLFYLDNDIMNPPQRISLGGKSRGRCRGRSLHRVCKGWSASFFVFIFGFCIF